MSRAGSSVRRLTLDVLDATHLLPFARGLYNAGRYVCGSEVRAANAALAKAGAPDGWPLPPPRLVYLVSGQFSVGAFLENGALGARCIREALSACGYDLRAFRAVLDFGCGCGRVLRHWGDGPGPRLFGCDYHPAPIEWARRAFPFAEFAVNPIDGPAPYADGTFDAIYAISVFTHLDADRQRAWMEELRRLLIPGGILLLTVLGTTHLGDLAPQERVDFEAGRLVVRRPRHAGSNICFAFHPEVYLRTVLARGFEVLSFVPGGARDAAAQDIVVLRKL